MYDLLFNDRKLGKYSTKEECFDCIDKFLQEHNYTSYYKILTTLSNTNTMIDVGSHTEFFYINEVSND